MSDLRGKIARAIAQEVLNPGECYEQCDHAEALTLADAALSTLPVSLEELDAIRAGTMVVVPVEQPPDSTALLSLASRAERMREVLVEAREAIERAREVTGFGQPAILCAIDAALEEQP